ncbi:MAG: GNAT family N-acetyltransferase [Acidobacteria bacterium]|nr:GNAT family N-acetyltransferase [Acidobacteriota bacterium]
MAQIREYRPEDAASVEECFVVLQNHERSVEPLRARGEVVLKPYLEFMFKRVAERGGGVFVAEAEGKVVGFVCLWLRNPEDELMNEPGEYAHISDLVVMPEYRGRRLGSELLRAAEDYARAHGATRLKIGVLARNEGARRLYENLGFEELAVFLTKELEPKQGEPAA